MHAPLSRQIAEPVPMPLAIYMADIWDTPFNQIGPEQIEKFLLTFKEGEVVDPTGSDQPDVRVWVQHQ